MRGQIWLEKHLKEMRINLRIHTYVNTYMYTRIYTIIYIPEEREGAISDRHVTCARNSAT